MKENILKWINGFKTSKIQQERKGFDFDQLVTKVKDAVTEFFDDDSIEKANLAYRQALSTPQFKNLLPYAGFLEQEETFLMDDNGFDNDGRGILLPGFVLEVMPQTGSDESMENVLQSIFVQAPKGTSISITMFGSPHIKNRMSQRANQILDDFDLGIEKEFWELRNTNVYRQAIRNRIKYYNQGAFEPLVAGQSGFLLRNYRCIISVVMPFSVFSPNALEHTTEFRDTMVSTLSSAYLPPVIWDKNDLLNWVADMLEHERITDPNHRRIEKEVNPELPILKDNFVQKGNMNAIKSNQIYFGNTDTAFASLSVTDFPKGEWFLSSMGNMIGDFFQPIQSYPCPFMISMIAITTDPRESKTKASMQSARKTQLRDSQSGRYVPGIDDEAAEWKFAVEKLEGGAIMVELGIKIALFSPKKTLKSNITKALAVWTNKGFNLSQDTFLQALSFKSIIPMGVTKNVATDLKNMGHVSPKFSSNAVALSPMISEWKGTEHNTITLFGRRGQILGFDFFDNDQGNYNFSIVGGSGSGKSVMTNEIAFAYLSIGTRVWIIDVGRSYEKLAKILGGDFIEFSDDSNIRLNPFTFIENIDNEMEILRPLLSQMMTGSDANLTSVQRTELQKCIKATWEIYGQSTTITKLRDVMVDMAKDEPNPDPILDMAKMLYPWTDQGVYGKYFDGPANLNFSNPFTVLELEELNNKKPLQIVVLMLLMYRISYDMYVNRDGTRSIVAIDEAWALLAGDDTAEFIETGFRRARKYNGAFGIITQSVEDFYKSAGALAGFNNSDWLCMLRQKKESVNKLEREGKIEVDPFKKRTLFSLTKKDGAFSEVYVSYPGGEGLGRLLLDPFTSLIYSSKDADFQAVRAYERQGMTIQDAINNVLSDRGIHVE